VTVTHPSAGSAVSETPQEPSGARERKKRETARAIEVAAVELAAEHGLGEVTIDAISARADVTSRTFFNYFASKEDAVLGNSRAFPPPTLAGLHHQPGRPVWQTALEAVRTQVGSFDFGSPRFQATKRALVLANPHLLAKDFQSLGTLEESFAESIRSALEAEGTVPAAERERHAWAIVIFIGSVMRLAMHDWSHESSARLTLAEHIDAACGTMLTVAHHVH
jgi:AcrR family transcriptional regulator